MAKGARLDLFYWRMAARQTRRVVLCSQIADQSRHAAAGAEYSEDFFEESCFAGTGTRNKTDSQNPRFAKALAQGTGDHVVLLQNIFANFHQTWFCAHSLISSATTSNSFPRRTVGVGVPHSEQQNNWIELTGLAPLHFGQYTSTGI